MTEYKDQYISNRFYNYIMSQNKLVIAHLMDQILATNYHLVNLLFTDFIPTMLFHLILNFPIILCIANYKFKLLKLNRKLHILVIFIKILTLIPASINFSQVKGYNDFLYRILLSVLIFSTSSKIFLEILHVLFYYKASTVTNNHLEPPEIKARAWDLNMKY